VTGIPGAFGNLLSILFVKIANWLTTHSMLGNIKQHGKNILVMRGCVYRCPEKIVLADNVIVGRNTYLTSDKCKEYNGVNAVVGMAGGYLIVNHGVSIGNDCIIDFSGGVTIGALAHIAHQVQITTHSHGYDYRNEPIGKTLEIGEGAFIGSRSIILYNCNRIGKNAVIGTGSVVTKDVPDNAIVAGNPARVIKYVT